MTCAVLLSALQEIRNQEEDCECMGGPDCCIEAGLFCPHCIADRAINKYLNLPLHQAITQEVQP